MKLFRKTGAALKRAAGSFWQNKYSRRSLKIFLLICIILLIILPFVYIFRWELFGGIVQAQVENAAAEYLDSLVSVGSMSGSLIGGVELRDIQIRPLADSFLEEPASVIRLSVSYSIWDIMTGKTIPLEKAEVWGLKCVLKEPEPASKEKTVWSREKIAGIFDLVMELPAADMYDISFRMGEYSADDISAHITVSRPDDIQTLVFDSSFKGVNIQGVEGGTITLRTECRKDEEQGRRISGSAAVADGVVDFTAFFDLPVTVQNGETGSVKGTFELREIRQYRKTISVPPMLQELWNVWQGVSGTYSMAGNSLETLTGNASVGFQRMEDEKNDTLEVVFKKGIIGFNPVTIKTPYGELELGGEYRLQETILNEDTRLRPLYAVLRSDVRQLEKYFPESLREMEPEGNSEVTLTVSGSSLEPDFSLGFVLTRGGLNVGSPLPPLEGIRLKGSLRDSVLSISSLSGDLGDRLFAASAEISLVKPYTIKGELKGNNLLILNSADGNMRLRLDADLKLSGTAQNLKLSGILGVPMFQYYGEFVSSDASEGKQKKKVQDLDAIIMGLGVDMPPAPEGGILINAFNGGEHIALDVDVQSRGDIRLQNSVFGVKLGGTGKIRGNASQMAISGDFKTESGEVRLFPGLFLPINQFKLTIPEKLGVEPVINFDSILPVGNVRVFIKITGPMASPRLQLSSDPPYSFDELAALIIYGHIPGMKGAEQAFFLQAFGKLFGGVAFDHMPQVEPSDTFLSRFILGFESGDPRFDSTKKFQQDSGDSNLYAEYMINENMSLVTEQDRTGSVAGFLEYTYRWPKEEPDPQMQQGEEDDSDDSDTPEKEDTGSSKKKPVRLGRMVRFSGIKAFNEKELSKVIKPDKPKGNATGWDKASMSDAAFRLNHFYREKGHYFVEITESFYDEGKPLFTVYEGPFVKMGKSFFTGNHQIGEQELRETLFTDRPSLLVTPFSTRLLDAQAKSLEEFYHEMGFLDAAVKVREPEYDESEKRMNVTYDIREGKRFYLESVLWDKAPGRDIQVLINMIQMYIGRPFASSLPETVSSRIRSFYRENGRPAPLVETSFELNKDRQTGSIRVKVTPGPRVTVDRIEVRGNKRVSSEFIRLKTNLEEGDLLRSSKVREAERDLSNTGLFKEVWTSPLDLESFIREGEDQYDEEFRVPLVLTLKEVQPHALKIRAGYSRYELGIFGMEVGTLNAFGSGESLSLGGTVSSRGYRTDGDLRFYPFPKYSMRAGAHLFYEDRDENSYGLRHAGVSPSILFTVGKREEYSLGIDFEWIQTDDLILGNLSSFKLAAPFVSYTRDRRNDRLLPRKGDKLNIRLEAADGDQFYGDISYWRAIGEYQIYQKLGRNGTLAASLRTGIISPFSSTDEIPIALRFFAGGVSSVRGFNDRELGPEVGGEYVGGEVFGTLQTEFRFRIVEDLHGAVFYDIGNVYADVSDLDFTDLRGGYGVSLRYYTPAGAISLDAGWNRDPLPKEEDYVLYFTIGLFF